VKYAIPLGAILLIGIASSLHRSATHPATPIGYLPARESASSERVERVGQAKPTAASTLSADPTERKAVAAVPGPTPGSTWKRMLGTLDRTVGLTAVQLPALEQLLREREIEIHVYQISWYRQMDSLLDGSQHERFLALLEKGFFNEGLELTIEPGMTVLE
jgi:hypothetical protein